MLVEPITHNLKQLRLKPIYLSSTFPFLEILFPSLIWHLKLILNIRKTVTQLLKFWSGQCLWHFWSHQLYFSPDCKMLMRERAMKFITLHWKLCSHSLSGKIKLLTRSSTRRIFSELFGTIYEFIMEGRGWFWILLR